MDQHEAAGRMEGRRDLYRRALDVVLSAVLGLIVLPVIVIVAAGSAFTLRAWPFFVQDRVGRDGALFRFVKVRTLPTDVPRYADKHQLSNHHIPAFCRFLRRFHLDELPQLFLVLTGRMSLVGPRPEMAELHQQMPPEFARERTSVRPGCTGLWQIGHACSDLIGAAPEFDRFYLAHRTVRLDLWVLARTALQMSGLGGLVSLSDVPRWALPPQSKVRVRVIDLTSLERSGALADDTHPVAVTAGR